MPRYTCHGSILIADSNVRMCRCCGDKIALVLLPGNDRAWECQNPHCGHTEATGAVLAKTALQARIDAIQTGRAAEVRAMLNEGRA